MGIREDNEDIHTSYYLNLEIILHKRRY